MENKVQLITYVDRIGCNNLIDLKSLIANEFKALFGGIHILPFFYPIDGADAGFDPIDHTQIDKRLGDWHDLKSLSSEVNIMSDLIVNHISAESDAFQEFLRLGEASKCAELFLTREKIFSNGANDEEIKMIYRPRLGLPFTDFKLQNGETKTLWTTFTQNQIDVDVNSNAGKAYLENILNVFEKSGINMIRLDAAGYAIKKAGTSCFMIEETFDFIGQLTEKAKARGIEVLVEIHSFYKTQIQIAKRVDYVYDFALPVLVLDSIFNQNATNLKNWLEVAPRNVITVLDTHDGIGIVDVASEGEESGLIPDNELDKIVEKIHSNSNNTSRKATGAAASNLDLYQVNCTYFDALGQDENAYLIARAIQFFVPGVPQVYYVGLLAGKNDMELLAKTNVGRDINRHYFTKNEIKAHLKTGFFKEFSQLIKFRNAHLAFNGHFELVRTPNDIIELQWTNANQWATLHVNLKTLKMKITSS